MVFNILDDSNKPVATYWLIFGRVVINLYGAIQIWSQEELNGYLKENNYHSVQSF